MKIQKLTIKEFKSIQDKEIDLKGRTVFLLGPNAAGKSSIIQAAFGQMPGEPLREGASKGQVEIQLGEYTCTFKYSKTNQKPTLTIVDKDGNTVKKPATVFSELFNITDFDIDSFLKLSGAKQVEAIKNLCGIDWTDQDAEYARLYKERTDKSRDADRVGAKLLNTVYKKDLPPVVPIEEVQKKMMEATKHNETVLKGENAKEQHQINIKRCHTEVERLKEEISKLESQIINHQAAEEAEAGKLRLVIDWLEKNPKKEIEAIQDEYNAVIEHNKAVEANNAVKALKDEAEGLHLELNDIERSMQLIKDMKATQLREAQDKGLLPVKGLSIDYEENTLKLDGLPFDSDQINTARKIIAGLEIQAALMSQGQVRIAKFDGSLLDKNNTEGVLKWAQEKDIQLFIEVVSRDADGLTIEVIEE